MLVAAVMAVVQVQNICDPTNTANVLIANFTGVRIDTITRRTLPYQMAVAIVATLCVVSARRHYWQADFTAMYRVMGRGGAVFRIIRAGFGKRAHCRQRRRHSARARGR